MLNCTITFIFGIVCITTSMVFNINNQTFANQTLPHTGGEIGPIVIEKDNTVAQVDLTQPLKSKGRQHWIYNTCEILDQDKEYLTSFGKEFWWESGYDEGHWEEKDTNYSTKITFQTSGNYFLNFIAETSPGETNSMNIRVYKKLGSGLPFMIAGIAAIILSGIMFFIFLKNTSK
jgi:hypothetical protein